MLLQAALKCFPDCGTPCPAFPQPSEPKCSFVGAGGIFPWMLVVFGSALRQWPQCRGALQVTEMAGEAAFGKQLVEIMAFTSSQLSLGRYFYTFTWLVFSFSELAQRMLCWVLFCFETVSQSDGRCSVSALISHSSHTHSSQKGRCFVWVFFECGGEDFSVIFSGFVIHRVTGNSASDSGVCSRLVRFAEQVRTALQRLCSSKILRLWFPRLLCVLTLNFFLSHSFSWLHRSFGIPLNCISCPPQCPATALGVGVP